MASEQDTIKEFLVGLGFKVDEAGQKKFSSGIDQSTKMFAKLAAFSLAATTAVGYAMSKFADSMEALYFSVQRTGSTASNIKALELTAQNFGASAAEALGSLEGIAAFMRNIPGGENFIRGLGVQTRDANGQLRDTSETLIDIGKQLSKMDFAHARVRAQVLGIDDKTLMALRNGEFEAQFRKAQQRLNTADFSGASARAHEFSSKLRDIGSEFSVLGVQVEAALLTRIGPKLDQFLAWMTQNGPVIAERISQIAEKFIDLAERAGPYIAALLDWLVKADGATDGWSTKILALAAAFKLLGGNISGTVSALPGFLAAAGKLGLVGAAAYGGYEAGNYISDKIEGTAASDMIGKTVARALALFGNDNAREALAMDNRSLGDTSTARGGVNMDQKTIIHVYGQDAATAGQSVALEQDRVNQRLMRNVAIAGVRG